MRTERRGSAALARRGSAWRIGERPERESMIVCISTYVRALTDEDEPLLREHFAFMDQQYREGRLIASGPRVPRCGGVIIARGADLAAVERLLAYEPLARERLATYALFAFRATRGASRELCEASFEDAVPIQADRCAS